MIGVSIASVLGAPLAAYVGNATSWRFVYFGATALAILALVLIVIAFPSLPARPRALDRERKVTLHLAGLMTRMLVIMLLVGGAQAFVGYLVPFLESVSGLGAAAIAGTLLLFGISGLAGTLMAPRALS